MLVEDHRHHRGETMRKRRRRKEIETSGDESEIVASSSSRQHHHRHYQIHKFIRISKTHYNWKGDNDELLLLLLLLLLLWLVLKVMEWGFGCWLKMGGGWWYDEYNNKHYSIGISTRGEEFSFALFIPFVGRRRRRFRWYENGRQTNCYLQPCSCNSIKEI